MKRKDYEKPTMTIVKLQHHGMLMTSNTEPVQVGNRINNWGNGGTTDEDIYM